MPSPVEPYILKLETSLKVKYDWASIKSLQVWKMSKKIFFEVHIPLDDLDKCNLNQVYFKPGKNQALMIVKSYLLIIPISTQGKIDDYTVSGWHKNL